MESRFPPIETKYLMYKNNLNHMEYKRLPKIASNSIQNHLQLKQGLHKYAKCWINHWGIKKEIILQNNDNIKNSITSKFKEKLWCDKEIEDKRKLRYYKEVVNPNIEDQKFLFVLTSVKKKINIVKIQINSNELHSETRCWIIPKTLWDERICHFCDTKRVKDENNLS
jgi:hypothetical protein